MFEPMIIVVSKEEVMTGDITSVCDVLNTLIESPETAKKYQERIDIVFNGFNDDSQELFENIAVRNFVHAIDDKFPFWLFFLSKYHLGFQALIFCFLPPLLTEEAKKEIFPKKIEELLCNRWFPALNHICEFVGLGGDEIDEITQRTFTYIDGGPITYQA